MYEPDRIAAGSRQFSAHLTTEGQLNLEYDGQPFRLEEISAAWCRRPNYYGEQSDRLRWLLLKDEYAALQQALWEMLPQSVWLNSPQHMQAAGLKLLQLELAASMGFRIPETLLSNSWESVAALRHETLVVKMEKNTVVPAGKSDKILPTTIARQGALPRSAKPYPGIWQQYIPKEKEWRVTVIGEKVFSAAIYTTTEAKDDWRRHQFTSRVTFRAERFPKRLQQKCIELVKHYGLRYGALDFVETPTGEIVFLEINPNGQFMWLETDLGLPVSAAIAEELMTIASSSTRI